MRARHALLEACSTAVRQPGPLHAFHERVRARRGHSVAVVAACAGSSSPPPSALTPAGDGIWHANDAVRQAERELARQDEVGLMAQLGLLPASASTES